ncbi:MAG: TonB family protein [Gammaproteobacteria bacterium]|nr:TonB family protein [Gammaproteobacteria bacterium]
MTDSSLSPTVLLISDDFKFIEQLTQSNTTEQEFHSRDSIQLALEDGSLLQHNGIVIFDLAVNLNDVDATIEQIIKLKKQDPTQIVILVGDAEPLAAVLTDDVQPLVYRAFSKPVRAKQLFLAFKRANRLHLNLLERVAAGQDVTANFVNDAGKRSGAVYKSSKAPNKSGLVYASITIASIGLAAWLLLGGLEQSSNTTESDVAVMDSAAASRSEKQLSADVSIISSDTAAFNELAAAALAAGNLTTPQNASALHYYDQALDLDPYDRVAYRGKKLVAEQLRSNFQQLIDDARFDEALATLAVLEELDPLNKKNDSLRSRLERTIEKHVTAVRSDGTKEEVAKTTAVLNKMGDSLGGSNKAAKALRREQKLLREIDTALAAGNLAPPTKGNAYTLVSNARKKNSISQANFQPRLQSLNTLLLASAGNVLNSGDLDMAEHEIALLRRLNLDLGAVAKLNADLTAKREAQIIAATETAEPVAPPPPTIIPAKAISQSPPKYPRRALQREQEGWVELAFTISEQGTAEDVVVVSAQPGRVFDGAAIRAVKRWKFQPAYEQGSGRAVASQIESIKLQFKLD